MLDLDIAITRLTGALRPSQDRMNPPLVPLSRIADEARRILGLTRSLSNMAGMCQRAVKPPSGNDKEHENVWFLCTTTRGLGSGRGRAGCRIRHPALSGEENES